MYVGKKGIRQFSFLCYVGYHSWKGYSILFAVKYTLPNPSRGVKKVHFWSGRACSKRLC